MEIPIYRRWEFDRDSKHRRGGSGRQEAAGIRRARRLARELVERKLRSSPSWLKDRITAHSSAVDAGGRTIAVIGTPLGLYYPKPHRGMQDRIAAEHLLISQVPVLRYERQAVPQNRSFFLSAMSR